MTDYVVQGLVKRRAELTGQIEKTHQDLHKMLDDLEKLDGTLTMFAPDFQAETIRPKAFRPPKDWSNRGDMSRVVLSIMRLSTEPMTTRDVALELLIERALDKHDLKLLRLMTKRVGVALRTQRERGVVESEQGPGQYMLWKMVR